MTGLSATKLDAATPAPEIAVPSHRALPAWVYSHPALTALEIERVLMPSWQIVCHVNSIPRPGDYETFDLGPESVFVLRDKDGSIKAFHNVCRHRGARLLDGAGTCAATITCPYHGWSYRQDGGLVGVPLRDTFPGLERAEHSLRPVRVDTALGFVFVCLAGDPPPVAKTWGKLAEELAPYRFEDMVPLAPISTDVWNVDWKIAMDNYLESYHVPIGHPGLYRMFTPDYEDQAQRPRGRTRLELDARTALLALVGARLSEHHRRGGQPPAGEAAPLLALLQCAAELRHRRVPRSDGFLPAPARRSRQVHRAGYDVRPSRCEPGVARRAISIQPHQHASEQRG